MNRLSKQTEAKRIGRMTRANATDTVTTTAGVSTGAVLSGLIILGCGCGLVQQVIGLILDVKQYVIGG